VRLGYRILNENVTVSYKKLTYEGSALSLNEPFLGCFMGVICAIYFGVELWVKENVTYVCNLALEI
jgi:hypothetical protein